MLWGLGFVVLVFTAVEALAPPKLPDEGCVKELLNTLVNRNVSSLPIPESEARCRLSTTDAHHLSMSCPQSNHVRFIGLGDWGEYFEAPYVLAVRDAVLKEAASGSYDFILTVGDNFYPTGVKSTSDPVWESVWRQRWHIGSELTLPWIVQLGNHDHYGNPEAQVAFHNSGQPGAPYWILPDHFYSLDVSTTQNQRFKITTLDTWNITSANLDWAAQEFNDVRAAFVLVAGHYHVYSADERGDTNDTSMLQLDTLMQGSPLVRAYLCGHEHDLQYHTAGAMDYFMFGGSGRTITKEIHSPGTHARTRFYSRNYGFATFDIEVATRVVTVTYHAFDASGNPIGQQSFRRQY